LVEIALNTAAMIGIGHFSAFEFVTPTIKNILWDRVSEAKSNELSETFLIEMRQVAATVPVSRILSRDRSHATNDTQKFL